MLRYVWRSHVVLDDYFQHCDADWGDKAVSTVHVEIQFPLKLKCIIWIHGKKKWKANPLGIPATSQEENHVLWNWMAVLVFHPPISTSSLSQMDPHRSFRPHKGVVCSPWPTGHDYQKMAVCIWCYLELNGVIRLRNGNESGEGALICIRLQSTAPIIFGATAKMCS